MIDGLIRAWARWEEHPASRDLVVELQVELHAIADAIGVPAPVLRERITTARRQYAGTGVTGAELRRCIETALGRPEMAA